MKNIKKCSKWGGKRKDSGRKKTCLNKVPFNRRINEKILDILKEYAIKYGLSDTEALESAIILQSNIDKHKEKKFMKIVIPSADGRLCGHFGHCENFTFVDVNLETKEIINIETKVPEEGVSCQSSYWISEQGANVVLAGGMGGRPLAVLEQNGIEVLTGCPELPIEEIVKAYIENVLETGENSCGGGHHCGGHGEGHEHHCGGHHNH